MIKLDLQFFGGRGAESSSRAKGGGGINSGDILSTKSLVSEREGRTQLVDDTLSVFRDVNDEYGYAIGDIELATLSDNAAGVLGYYDGKSIAINEKYFGANIESAYAESVKSGYHPSSGNKTALQAVTAHELGHALTDAAGAKLGISGIDNIATAIVKEARKQTKHKGVVQMSSKISKYATTSNAEALAEAFSDVFCNGAKAAAESKAIVNVMNKYLK